MITIILVAIVFAIIGWKARGKKDEFDHDIDMIFKKALRNN